MNVYLIEAFTQLCWKKVFSNYKNLTWKSKIYVDKQNDELSLYSKHLQGIHKINEFTKENETTQYIIAIVIICIFNSTSKMKLTTINAVFKYEMHGIKTKLAIL